MKVLHVCASRSVNWGGPPRVVAALCAELAERGVESTVIAADILPGTVQVEGLEEAHITRLSRFSTVWPGYGADTKRRIAELARDADILHVHELWHYPSYAAAKVARQLGKPYIVSSHGELQDSFFRRKIYKKAPYWLAVQRPALQNAAAVHVLNSRERDDALRRGVRSRILLLPNGVDRDFNAGDPVEAKRRFFDRYPETREKTVVLYLGRLAPIKRVEVLINAVAEARRLSPGQWFHLVLLGPEAPGYGAKLHRLAAEQGMTEAITFGGSVSGQPRLDAYIASDVYAQASEGEGYSLSILEASSSGLPVIVTKECEFPAEEYGLGAVTEGSPEMFAKVLVRVAQQKRAGTLPVQDGLAKFRMNHSWCRRAEQFEIYYREAIENANAPSA